MEGILECLSIERIAFHKIFKREYSGYKKPEFNNRCEKLGVEERNEIENRVVAALGNDSKAMKMDIVQSGEGTVFNFIAPFFRYEKEEEEFVHVSRQITEKLANAQVSKRIPGGAVMVFDGTVGIEGHRFFGVIKAEEDNGFIIEKKAENMALKFIKELLLTKNQKIYKVAMLIDKGKDDEIRQPSDIEVYIYDSNNSTSRANAKAAYFYDNFLGCEFPKSSDFLTKDFYENTKNFVKIYADFTEEEKLDLNGALYTYLKMNINNYINVQEFAATYFKKTEIQDNYVKFMKNKKVPMINFKKDISLLSSKLKRRTVKFTGDIKLIAPSEKFLEDIEIKQKQDNSTVIAIKGTIQSEV